MPKMYITLRKVILNGELLRNSNSDKMKIHMYCHEIATIELAKVLKA